METPVDPPDAAHRNGGFDCEFETKPKELQSECSVCLLILREPHLTSCCGYSFCQGCIEQIKATTTDPVCPLCKSEFSILPNKWLKRELYQQRVYCSHKKEGCDWVGPLGQLDKHLSCDAETSNVTNGCGFVPVKCRNCSASILRKEHQIHVSTLCDNRPFSCDYCSGYNSTYVDVVHNHWPQCPCHPVECVNKCGKQTVRKDLRRHISNECPLTSIQCEFCLTKVLRGKMHEHLMLNLTTHILLMVNPLHEKLDKAEEEICLLTYENQHLRDNVEDEIRKLTLENRHQQDSVKEEICKLTNENWHVQKEKICKLIHENRHLQDNVERLCLRADKNEEEIRRLREDNLEIRNLCSKVHQQNDKLTRSYESLQKEYEALKQENEELLVRADVLSADIAYFKLKEKEKESASSETLSQSHHVAAENAQASDRNAATYYEFSDLELSQASSSGYLQDYEIPDHRHDPSISGLPITLIMSNYSAYSSGRKNGKCWMSKPFYSGIQPSYKLCLSVRASGNLSVYVRLMRGDFDDVLAWPFNANITIQLMNHGRRGRYWERKIVFRNGHRVVKGDAAIGGRGDPNFITLFENSSFIKDNALSFKVVGIKLL